MAGKRKRPTKKAIKTLFRAIRNGEEPDVRFYIESDQRLVNCCASAPPKKDDGQSPLQIAFKTGQFAIADFLIDCKADVDFIEQSDINQWRVPVVHDAIRATAFNMGVAGRGYRSRSYDSNLKSQFKKALDAGIVRRAKSEEKLFPIALGMLEKLFAKGANPNATDSYGNSCLIRALLDLRIQLQSIPLVDVPNEDSDSVFDKRARQLLGTLIDAGADIHMVHHVELPPGVVMEDPESAFEYVQGTYFERLFTKKGLSNVGKA